MWHCPHCGAPQAETARCWVCRRSSTTCSTCRHFRTSLAADVGYCAKDRWRTPLTGLELRACWEEGRGAALPGESPDRRPSTSIRGDGGPLDRPNPMRLRGFVPVEELGVAATEREEARPAEGQAHVKRASVADPRPVVSQDVGAVMDDWERRVSLFGEAEG